MSDDDLGKTELIRCRVEPSRKVAYQTAADALELDLSEWLRQAGDEKLQRDHGMTVGAPRRQVPRFEPAHGKE